MKARGVVMMGTLAAASLGAAYLTWQRPKETKSDNTVTVLDASKTSLEKIHFDDGTRFIDVTRRVDGEPVVWLRSGYLDGKAPVADAGSGLADGGAGDGGLPDGGVKPPVVMPPPLPPQPTRELRGNDTANKVWERFAPLEAVRALGALPDAKLKDLGLDVAVKTLEVTVAGTPRRFKVSSPSPGFVGQYVLDEKSKEVYLLAAGTLSDLEPSSTGMVDRRLHAFKAPDFDAFKVTVDGKSKEFVQSDAQISQKTKVAAKATPDKPDEFVKNWHDKVWNRIIVTEVLGKGETPLKGEPAVVMRVDYFSKGQVKGWFEAARVPNGTEVYGRSEQTAGWVALHAGIEEMALEAKKLVSE